MVSQLKFKNLFIFNKKILEVKNQKIKRKILFFVNKKNIFFTSEYEWIDRKNSQDNI